MSDPTRSDVTRPADLAGASLRELLEVWHRHTARLVERHGLGDQLPAARPATASTPSPSPSPSGRRSSTS